jgi:uncharacterized protein (UPF0264 family)
MAKIKTRALENLKYEVADELGVRLGADQTSRNNGKVGGELVRRLIEQAESTLSTTK